MVGWDFEVGPKKGRKKKKPAKFDQLILHEDDRIVVVNKPADIASLSDREDVTNMLVMAQEYNPDLQICHRLDKHTTGVLLFAKNPQIYSEIAGLFAKREVLKHYFALVHGAFEYEEEMIDLPISVSGSGNGRIDPEGGKESATVISTAEKFRDFTLINAHPLTGRMHQIRVHMQAIGAPLVGDTRYGGKDIFLSAIKRNYKWNRKEVESPINEEYLLHARGMQIVIPGDEEPTTFLAPVPKRMEVALKVLRRHGRK